MSAIPQFWEKLLIRTAYHTFLAKRHTEVNKNQYHVPPHGGNQKSRNSWIILLSAKIIILAIAPLSFISVSIFCEFAMMPDVYILLSCQEEEVHSFSGEDICTHLEAHSSKRLNSLSVIMLVCLGNTLKNKTNCFLRHCSS